MSIFLRLAIKIKASTVQTLMLLLFVTPLKASPAKILWPFLSTAPLQYVPKILFTQAIIDCLTINKTKNAHNDEMVILNYICGDPISRSLSNGPFVNVL